VTLRREYASPADARRLAAALAADQPSGLVAHTRGRVLSFEFTAPTPESARATGDDLLACLSAAERTTGLSLRRPPDDGPGEPDAR
jgi:hypothetical protein